MSLRELTTFVAENCEPDDSFFAPYLAILRYLPLAITIGSFAVSAIYRELLIGIVGVILTFSGFVNVFLLKPIIRQPIPYATCGDDWLYCVPNGATECGGTSGIECVACGMPSYLAQQLAVFSTCLMTYSMRFVSLKLTWLYVFLVVGIESLASFSAVHFGMNTPEQVMAGKLVGVIIAFVSMQVVFVFLHSSLDRFLYSYVNRAYLKYGDTLMRDHAPVAHYDIDRYASTNF